MKSVSAWHTLTILSQSWNHSRHDNTLRDYPRHEIIPGMPMPWKSIPYTKSFQEWQTSKIRSQRWSHSMTKAWKYDPSMESFQTRSDSRMIPNWFQDDTKNSLLCFSAGLILLPNLKTNWIGQELYFLWVTWYCMHCSFLSTCVYIYIYRWI